MADEVAQEVTNSGGEAITIQADLKNTSDVEKMFSEVASKFGGLDVLINNAGTILTA